MIIHELSMIASCHETVNRTFLHFSSVKTVKIDSKHFVYTFNLVYCEFSFAEFGVLQ